MMGCSEQALRAGFGSSSSGTFALKEGGVFDWKGGGIVVFLTSRVVPPETIRNWYKAGTQYLSLFRTTLGSIAASRLTILLCRWLL